MAYFRCLYGGAQYKKDTDLWATDRKGMINAPDFGRVLPKDRFVRINRYLQVPLPPKLLIFIVYLLTVSLFLFIDGSRMDRGPDERRSMGRGAVDGRRAQ